MADRAAFVSSMAGRAVAGKHAPGMNLPAMRWRDAAPVLAYDDDDIRVVFQPGGSDLLLVTFGDAVTLAHGLTFAADALARKHDLACLGFIAHRPNWYPVPAMRRALPHVAYTLKSFQRRLLYGSSMGGYAALKHARLLGATDVMALAPQWSIDVAECAPEAPGYQECFVSSMAGMGIRAEDMAGRIAIFLDPGLASDMWHMRAIVRRSPEAQVFDVHCTDHHTVSALAGSDAMWAIMRAWLDGDPADVVRSLNRRRRRSPIRTCVLLDRAVPRHPGLALRAVEHALRVRAGQGVDSRTHVGGLLAAALVRDGQTAARNVLRRAWGALPPIRAEALRCALEAPNRPGPGPSGLLTAHGAELCYDLVAGALRAHPASSARPPWLPAAPLGHAGEAVLLAIPVQDRVLACTLDASGGIELAEIADVAPGAAARGHGIGGRRFNVTLGGRYLCALPDGAVCHDREHAQAWEVFRLAG